MVEVEAVALAVLVGVEAGALAEVAAPGEVVVVIQPGAEIVPDVFGMPQPVVPSSVPLVWHE